MAKADPGSGPVSLFPVSNKLQGNLNLLREVIEGKKLEVRRIGSEMRSLIERKEEEVIKELGAIWEEVSARSDEKKRGTQKLIEEIETHQKEMEKLFKCAQRSLSTGTQVSEAIESLKNEMDINIPYVKLSWRVEELTEAISRLCRCEQQVRDNTQYQLKWSACEKGEGANQVDRPWGIAISPANGNIYVADHMKNLVQIFSEDGEWIKSLKDDETIKPENMLLQNESVYVQCEKKVLKFNQSSELIKKSKPYTFRLKDICSDSTHVYVGHLAELKLIFFSLDLIEENQMSLNTEFSDQADTQILNVNLAEDIFYVLLTKTEFPIQAFSKEGILTRCVVQKDSIVNAYYFCIDQQLNLIVSDRGDFKVKIFSNEGALLTHLFREGQFTELSGVAVDDLGCVIVADRCQDKVLHAFI